MDEGPQNTFSSIKLSNNFVSLNKVVSQEALNLLKCWPVWPMFVITGDIQRSHM